MIEALDIVIDFLESPRDVNVKDAWDLLNELEKENIKVTGEVTPENNCRGTVYNAFEDGLMGALFG